jgi:hypothetical protein
MLTRARSLDKLRASGLALPLTWDVFFYTVVISEFYADYQNSWWIPYRITCMVQRDEAAASVEAFASLATSALTDISAAAIDAQGADFDLSPVQAALGAPGATVRSTAAYCAAQASLSTVRASMDASIGAAEMALAGVDLANANSPDVGAAKLVAAADLAGQLGWITSARSYVARAAVNLTNAST